MHCVYVHLLYISTRYMCIKPGHIQGGADQESKQGSKAAMNKEAFPVWCYSSNFLPPVPTSVWWAQGPAWGSTRACPTPRRQNFLKPQPRTALEMRLDILISQRKPPICKRQTFQRTPVTITTKERCFLRKSSLQYILWGKTTLEWAKEEQNRRNGMSIIFLNFDIKIKKIKQIRGEFN